MPTTFPERLSIGSGAAETCARNHAICDGAAIVARVHGAGYPIGTGWAPQTEALAAEMVRRYNAFGQGCAVLGDDAPLYVAPVGKNIRVTAIFDNDAEANAFMEANGDQSVIATYGKFIMLARNDDRGAPAAKKAR